MLVIGLTGGVASGKNFVADQFKKLRVPVYDADFEVHKLLKNNSQILKAIKDNFPDSVIKGSIDTKYLAAEVFRDKEKLLKLEAIIYPYLAIAENRFIKKCRLQKKRLAILNIPLLFEKDGYKRCHKSIAVITPLQTQKIRFVKRQKLKNPELSEELINERFKKVTQNQISNYSKKKRADFLIYNGLSKNFTIRQFKYLYSSLIKSVIK